MQPREEARTSPPSPATGAAAPLPPDCRALLSELYGSTQPPLLLDVRAASQHLDRRLAGSVNIPLDGLTRRCCLLPDKACAFAVVVPAASDVVVTTDPAQHGARVGAATAVYLKGAASLPEFLSSRGWRSVSAFLRDAPATWDAARHLGVLEQGPPADPVAAARRCLFAPSELLACSIAGIEASLVAQRPLQGRRQVPADRQQQQQQQQRQHAPPDAVLRALDVGCGSGRDMCWLASRRSSVPAAAGKPGSSGGERQQPADPGNVAVRWHVTGVDEWLGALERAAECAEAMQLTAQHVQLLYARVCPETGRIKPLRVPAKSSLNGSPLTPAAVGALCAQHCADQPAGELPHGSHPSMRQAYELVVCCRVLIRALFPALRQLLAPGAYVVYSTFLNMPGVRAAGRPAGADRLLQPGELASQHFGPDQGFVVLRDEVCVCPDGRELCWFVARKQTS